MYDRILIPTDGSDVARAAAEAAIALAGRYDADLHAVHVLAPGERVTGSGDRGDRADRDDRGDPTVAVARMAADAGIEATTATLERDGPVHRTILDYAAGHGVDCVVMGTSGRTGLDRYVLGSVAERTVRESPVPVMTVHADTVLDPAFEAVLVPTDGSDCARAAAGHAIDLARTTGAALHVVNVVDIGAVIGDDIDVGTVLDALEEAGRLALDRVIERAEDADVSTVEASVLTGTPYRSIVEYAVDHDVDCIVLGTHGRTGVDRLLLGSVAERVVRLSEVPVMTVKAEGGEASD